MGVVPHTVGESERGDVEFQSDFEVEEERQREVLAMEGAGFVKRTYGVRSSCLEHSCAKLDQQLDGLRAVVPNSTSRRERSDSIVVDAYYYIATLQKQVEDLSSELLEDASLARTQDEEIDERSLPMVEVMKRDGVLEVRMVCANRPGLLVDVMEAVESRGLTVVDAKIASHSNIVFEYLSLESEESVTDEGDEESELDSVKAMLVNAICGSALQ